MPVLGLLPVFGSLADIDLSTELYMGSDLKACTSKKVLSERKIILAPGLTEALFFKYNQIQISKL
jgi:hypothetical protein